MKLAVLSDVHGNVPALEAVLEDLFRWRPDMVVVNGDLINRGPCSLRAWQRLQAAFPRARYIRGNHEDFVLQCCDDGAAADGGDGQPDLWRFTRWTHRQMGTALAEIAGWDDFLELLDVDGGSIHITHGSCLGKRDGISSRTADSELPDKLGTPRDLFIASHTHKPLQRHFGATLVVNTGSVGAPFDEDHRASYARFQLVRQGWQAEIVRVAYDWQLAARDFVQSGFLDGGGPLARLMLEELRRARGLLGPWMRGYHDAVITGEMGQQQAVEAFLAGLER